MSQGVNKTNVGRIAERIVANELAYRGFRVSDLNKEGTSENADLVAVKEGRAYQIQVKGASRDDAWPWINLGHCNEEVLAGREKMFNRCAGFYKAEFVVCVSVKSPRDYVCVIMPVGVAEELSTMVLDREFRTPRIKDGLPKKPGPVWLSVRYVDKSRDQAKQKLLQAEQKFIDPYIDNWNVFDSGNS